MVDFELTHNAPAIEETPSYDCNSFNGSVKHLSNSRGYGSWNKIIDAKIARKETKNLSTDKLI